MVVDDGSTDSTAYLLEEKARCLKVLKWYSQAFAGPAAARNRALREVDSEIVFFTGDDMRPNPNLLAEHLKAQKELDGAAVLGRVEWDPDCKPTILMRFMAPNGPFFNYSKLLSELARISHQSRVRHGIPKADPTFPVSLRSVDHPPGGKKEDTSSAGAGEFHRFFYTANLSIPMNLLGDERFNEEFRSAAFEDTELGLRVLGRGVRLKHRAELVVWHYHPMAARDVLNRLRNLAEGRAVYERLHPEFRATRVSLMRDKLLELLVKIYCQFCG